MSVEICPARAHTRIGWYRSVDAIHHRVAAGSFVDELAHAAGKNSETFLLEPLGPDRKVDLSEDGLAAPASNYGGSWTTRSTSRGAPGSRDRDGEVESGHAAA